MELGLYLITFLISSIPALFLSAPPVEDALSTMGSAAFLAGYDWRVFLAEDGFFYKYGQAIWYIPVYCLIKNPVIRYKLLLLVNSALDAFIPVIVYRISRRLSERKVLKNSEAESFMISLVTGMMPSILLYDKYTWAEPVLMLMPWAIMYILLSLTECSKSDFCEGVNLRRTRRLSAALAWAAVYDFMSHQRGIVVVIATTMTVIIYRLVTGKKLISPAVYVVNLIAALGVDRALNYWVRQVVYLGVKPKYNTLAGFLRPEIYQKLFSLKGQQTVFRTFMGWMFNTSVSGLCITLLGLFCMLVVVIRTLCKKRHVEETIFVFSLQGVLAFFGAMALGMLFFFETLYGYWEGTDVVRCDHLVFGRYIESSLPVLMFAGMIALKAMAGGNQKRSTEKTVICSEKSNCECSGYKVLGIVSFRMIFITFIISFVLVLYFAIRIAPAMEGIDSYVHSVMSMNVAFDMTGVTVTRDIISNLPTALTIAGIVAVAVFGVMGVCIYNHSKAEKSFILAICILILCIFCYIYLRSFIDIIYRVDSNALTKYAQYYLING